jgi:hypothetical protein
MILVETASLAVSVLLECTSLSTAMFLIMQATTSTPMDIVKRHEVRTLAYIGYELAALAYNNISRDRPNGLSTWDRVRSTAPPPKLIWRLLPTCCPSHV